MGDIDEEIIDGPKVSSALEWGGTYEKPRTRDKFWYRAILTETPPDEGLIWRVGRRPRTRRNEDPHPTVRLMRENPKGILFAKVKAGEILVENYYDFTNRMILQARDEEKKAKKNKKSSKSSEDESKYQFIYNPNSEELAEERAVVDGPRHYRWPSMKQASSSVQVNLVWSRSLLSAEKLASQYGSHVVVAHASSSDDAEFVLDSAREALHSNRSDIDAVILAVPILQLAPFSQMILAEGIHVLAEKPLAADLKSARLLLQESETSNAIHAIAENFRFEPVFKKAHELLKGVCGNVISVQLTAQTPMPPGSRYGRGWRLDLTGTGILLDGMVHHIAGMRVVLGADITRVCAICMKQTQAFSGPDTVNGAVEFANGVPGTIFVTYAGSTFSWSLRVIGTAGDVVVQRSFPRPGYKLSTIRKVEGKNEVTEEHLSFSGIDSEFKEFIESCHSGAVHPDLDSKIAYNDLATVCALVSSSDLKQWVDVDHWECSNVI